MVFFKSNLSLRILKVQLVACLVANSLVAQDQNYITPLKDKNNLTTSGVTGCPSVDGVLSSPCKSPCQSNEDCMNHGNLICCATAAGSKCDAECVSAIVLTNSYQDKVCNDHTTKKSYTAGEIFVTGSGDECCTCLRNGALRCTVSMHMCEKGCFKDKKYFRNGEIVEENSCKNCTCQNRSIVCHPVKECSQGSCEYKSRKYKEGDELQLDHSQGCRQCICTSGRWKCEVLTCNAAYSRSRAITLTRTGIYELLVGSYSLVSILLLRLRVPFIGG